MSGQARIQTELEFALNARVPTGIDPGKVREIPLTQGKVALVDAEDYERLSVHSWYAYKSEHTFYARRNIWTGIKKQTAIQMHREIMHCFPGDGTIIDHINFNGLDNRKENIRIVQRELNIHRRHKQRNNTSGYIGVFYKKSKRLWYSTINIDGKRYQCGSSKDIMKVVRNRDKIAFEHYGKDAILNFPEEYIK